MVLAARGADESAPSLALLARFRRLPPWRLRRGWHAASVCLPETAEIGVGGELDCWTDIAGAERMWLRGGVCSHQWDAAPDRVRSQDQIFRKNAGQAERQARDISYQCSVHTCIDAAGSQSSTRDWLTLLCFDADRWHADGRGATCRHGIGSEQRRLTPEAVVA